MAQSLNSHSAVARQQDRFRQCGMTLLELMIALSVLSIGMLGATGMILAGVQSNTRNKTDSTAVVLDQEILEKFATLTNYPKSGTATIFDCGLQTGSGTANQHLASLTQGTVAAGGAGAILYTTSTAPLPSKVGDIDWTQATPTLATAATAGYAMQYRACNGDTYEVRWNIMEVNPNANGLSRISMLTVSSRQLSAQSTHASILFSNPTTLRTLIEN